MWATLLRLLRGRLQPRSGGAWKRDFAEEWHFVRIPVRPILPDGHTAVPAESTRLLTTIAEAQSWQGSWPACIAARSWNRPGGGLINGVEASEGLFPRRLKPRGTGLSCGTAEAVPFQNAKAVPFQNAEAVPFQNEAVPFQNAEAVPFQNRFMRPPLAFTPYKAL